MTDLERFAALLLAEWQSECGRTDAALDVGDLLDKTFSYKKARRALSLESSEYYDLLVLRLASEEAGLVQTSPGEAAEIARTTLASKVPDLDQLQLIRTASVTFSDDAVNRLEGVRPLPNSGAPSKAVPAQEEESSEPVSQEQSNVIPIRPVEEESPTVQPVSATAAEEKEIPEPFLTGVAFTPPESTCWQCNTPWPAGRSINFCVECGSDQRTPHCHSCNATVEREWKHCAECGSAQGRQ